MSGARGAPPQPPGGPRAHPSLEAEGSLRVKTRDPWTWKTCAETRNPEQEGVQAAGPGGGAPELRGGRRVVKSQPVARPQAPGPLAALRTVNGSAQNVPGCLRAAAVDGGLLAVCGAPPDGRLGVRVKPGCEVLKQRLGCTGLPSNALPLPDWNIPPSTGRLVGQGCGRWTERGLLPVLGGPTVPGWHGARPAFPLGRHLCRFPGDLGPPTPPHEQPTRLAPGPGQNSGWWSAEVGAGGSLTARSQGQASGTASNEVVQGVVGLLSDLGADAGREAKYGADGGC